MFFCGIRGCGGRFEGSEGGCEAVSGEVEFSNLVNCMGIVYFLVFWGGFLFIFCEWFKELFFIFFCLIKMIVWYSLVIWFVIVVVIVFVVWKEGLFLENLVDMRW